MVRYIGVDVHKNKCVATIVNEKGEVAEVVEFENTPEDWKEFTFRHCRGRVSVAMEATTYAMKAYEILKELGIEVHLANTYKLRLISESQQKTDKNDSETLAQLLRTGYFPEAYIPPEEVREIRDMLRYRTQLVQKIVKIKNQIHALLSANLIDLSEEYSDIFGKEGREELRGLRLPPSDRFRLDNYLDELEFYEKKKDDLERYLRTIGIRNPLVRLIMTIPGVGDITAMTIVYEIWDFSRFSSPRKLAAYAGLVPSVRASGDKVITGSVRRDSNHHLKRVLVEAAHVAIRFPGRLKRFYSRIARRKGHNIAIVAVARKLITIIFAMVKNNERYRDEDVGLTERKLKRMAYKAGVKLPSPPHSTVACAEPSPSARRPKRMKKSRMRMQMNPSV